jgi:ABC-type Fe3+ transport system permease subunit
MENNTYEKLRVLQFNISALNRFLRIDFLKIKKELIIVSSSCFVLSMGDLTSITLFNSSNFKTVPYLISQLYSSYRYDDAFFILAIFVLFIVSFLYIVNSLAYKNVKTR